jgi:hypothetical protein
MKSFRYIFTPDFRPVTEEQIRAQIASGKMSSAEIVNAEKVLALEIGEMHVLDSGAEFTRVEDDTPPQAVILCTRGRESTHKCEFCGVTVKAGKGSFQCDGQAQRKKSKTCDAWMCGKCRTNVGPNRDLCPNCVAKGEDGRLRA